MRKTLFLTIGFCLLLASPAMAQDAVKIGIVNLERIFTQSNAGKRVKGLLQGKASTHKAKMDKMQADITKLKNELDKQSAVLSQEAKQGKAAELRKMLYESQIEYKTSLDQLMEEEAKLLQPLKDTLVDVITKFGTANNYTMIVDSQNGGVIYAATFVDVTKAILDEFNKVQK